MIVNRWQISGARFDLVLCSNNFVEYPFLCLILNRCHTDVSYIWFSLVNLCFTFSIRTHQKRFRDILLHAYIFTIPVFIFYYCSFTTVQAVGVRNLVFVSKSCRAPIKFLLSWIRARYDVVYYSCLFSFLFFTFCIYPLTYMMFYTFTD